MIRHEKDCNPRYLFVYMHGVMYHLCYFSTLAIARFVIMFRCVNDNIGSVQKTVYIGVLI